MTFFNQKLYCSAPRKAAEFGKKYSLLVCICIFSKNIKNFHQLLGLMEVRE